MGFVKLVKNKAYFKRYQVKYRRRREGKTDYKARRAMITQDKNKYASPKYRLVVRITNQDVVAQVVHSKIVGDFVVTAAYSHELPRYGVKFGLTNYAAAYATGLLCARRVLNKLGLDDKYVGAEEVTGEYQENEQGDNDARPFHAILDVGLARTTTGARVFAVLKGAVDGGLDIPHSERRFAGYNPEDKSLDADTLRKYIFGGHVADYMRTLQEEEPEKYKSQFSRMDKAGMTADKLEGIYASAHKAIRADPTAKLTKKNAPAKTKRWNTQARSYEQRKDRVKQKKAAAARE